MGSITDLFFDKEKLKAKKEITLNLLNDRICDNCIYYVPVLYSIALHSHERENCVKTLGKKMPIPKLRTCKEWKIGNIPNFQ